MAAAELRRERVAYIMFVEILPNVLPAILVEATVRLGYSIFTVASLSFIGFGIQPPSPDWGLSIASNYGMIGGDTGGPCCSTASPSPRWWSGSIWWPTAFRR